LIWLHSIGSNGEKLAASFTPTGKFNLPPTTRIVIPTAPRRKEVKFSRVQEANSWYSVKTRPKSFLDDKQRTLTTDQTELTQSIKSVTDLIE
jgi:hypothetical protein